MMGLFLVFLGTFAMAADSLLASSSSPSPSPSPSDEQATKLVARAEDHTLGRSFEGLVTMTVENGGTIRMLRFRVWSEGKDKALIKVLEPAKDRGTANLRLSLDLWQYLPNVERIIKIPTSMMLQSWMGSDFTHDDLVKTSSLLRDYTHRIEAHESMRGERAIRVLCTPKSDAPVVWGKVLLWVRERDAAPLQQEFYSEKGELLRRLEGTELRAIGRHAVPSVLTMTNLRKENSRTRLVYETQVYDELIPAQVFTLENLRRPAKVEPPFKMPASD